MWIPGLKIKLFDLAAGKSLPVQCLPTSSGSEEVKSASKQPKKPKVVNGRQLSYSGKRRKEVIDGLKEQNKEEYRPSPGSKYFAFQLGPFALYLSKIFIYLGPIPLSQQVS